MKIIPASPDAEKSVLGSIFNNNKNLSIVSDKLFREDFHSMANGTIFEVMKELGDKGMSIEPLVVKQYLDDKGLLEKSGGLKYINSLLNFVVSEKNLDSYVKIIKEKSTLRELIDTCSSISEDCFNNEPTLDIFDKAEKGLLSLIRKSSKQGFQPVKDVVEGVIHRIEQVYEKKESVIGVPSGFTDLDKKTSGWHGSDLVILAARPAMGKTALCLNFAINAALKKVPVAFFSLEMSAAQLVQRVLASEAEIDQDRLKKGTLSDSDFSRLVMAAGKIFEAPLYINDTGGLTLGELKAAARKAYMEHDIKLLIIDYLQLLSVPSKKNSREQEIAEISRALKGLAKEFNIPVIALAQLSRAVEQRNDKRPMLSDLRESGAIEQDADMVMFIYRDDYYNEDSQKPNVTELIIGKHRNGPTGTVELFFRKESTKFHDLKKEY
ncbi:MAG: replicative DNA helicase [Candidatus Muiribacterium halophilum]|uniref:Replicative DNA helicase n=1 Tax=Muiribacterium halophilum TaxID=2053465 RepID=A0A2N5ZEW6_MUIH1|nr:MAG: replicative DNA helicase [Candidatus Muirbacterium halophilum]